ncbi:substrate-binding domain-containing protein [Oceanobacillus jeddahense]|uniref:Fe/B12 periplasmic-binding domain-containing protein n=1 Tax=Oceanobacillus jeddahense TaxID=1462527 RepID=A0ABY5JMN5_9BACI|nr:hypothetical protein [Oceanobacillus jeddahense]UUI01075.1 hypothetical protein NP439_13460 [Oceanobacillus jeddahense]
MDLTGPEALTAVTSSMEEENLSHFSEEAMNVENRIQGATSLDPETVLSFDPDLILLTLTHGSEEASDLLTGAGTPIVSFDRWMTLQDVMDNYEAIGQLVGEEEKLLKLLKICKKKWITQNRLLMMTRINQPY